MADPFADLGAPPTTFRVAGWNHQPRPNDDRAGVKWVRVVADDDVTFPYPYAYFVTPGNSLFESQS